MATSQANPLAKQYLTNKELLKEIHLSKNRYSSYSQPEYSDYDLILPSVDKINIRTIADAKRTKALRLSQLALAEAQKINPKTIKSVDVKKEKSNGEIRIVSKNNNSIEDAEIVLDNNVISKEDLNKSEYFILTCLAIPTLFFGFYPEPLINTIEVSVNDLINMYNANLLNK